MTDMNSIFGKNTADWFAEPRRTDPVQKEAWLRHCGRKEYTGVRSYGYRQDAVCLLVFIDRLTRQARGDADKAASPDLYLPLKSLAADIRENLRRPLTACGAGRRRN